MDKLSNVPMLCICAGNEEVLSGEHRENYKRMRERACGETRFVDLSCATHTFPQYTEKQKLIEETVLWCKEYM